MAEFGKGNEQFVIHLHVYNHDDAEQGVREFCAKNGIQLVGVVSGKRSHSAMYAIVTTETLIFNSDLGVLKIKA